MRLALVFLLLVPSAVGISISVPESIDDLELGGEFSLLEATISINCLEELLAGNPIESSVEVKLSRETSDPGITVSGPTNALFDCSSPTDAPEKVVTFQVGAQFNTPALQPVDITIYAESAIGNVSDTSTVIVLPSQVLSIQSDDRMQETVDGKATFQVTVANFGNTDSTIEVSIDEIGPGVTVAPIEPFTLAAGASRVMEVDAALAGERQANFILGFTPTANNGAVGPTVQASFTLREGAENEEAPAPAIALVALALLAARRR